VVCALLALALAAPLSAGPSRSQGDSAPAWLPGDRWSYLETDCNLGECVQYNSTREVQAEETVVLGDIQVQAYRVLTRTERPEQMPFFDGSVRWYRASDLAEVRFRSGNAVVGWTYDPPFAFLEFPMEPGPPREVTSTVRSDSGNTTQRWSVVQVVAIRTIEVPAGTFEAYEILEASSGRRFFFASSAAWFVKIEGELGPDHTAILTRAELEPRGSFPFLQLAGVAIVGAFVSAAVVIVLRRKRGRGV